MGQIGEVRESAERDESFVAQNVVDDTPVASATSENEPTDGYTPSYSIEPVVQDTLEQRWKVFCRVGSVSVYSPDHGKS